MGKEKIKKIKKKILEKSKKIIENNLISENDKILIAFSGGPDSVFLYYFLNFLKKKLEIEVSLVYINHNLRSDVENDLQFVKKFAAENNTDYYIESINVNKYAKEKKKSVELAARELRYEAIENIRKIINYDKIATGHNLDDNVETFIFRLLRGTSLSGLRSIPKVRGNIIRPILEFEKSEILDFLKNENQEYIMDYTNNENNYTRNFIRNKIFPDFDKINPSFRKKIHMLIGEINDRDFENIKFGDQNAEILEKKEILKQNGIIRKDNIALFLKKNNIEVSREKINQIFKSFFDENGNLKTEGSTALYLGKNKILKNEYGKLEITEENFRKKEWNLKNGKINNSFEKSQILKENQSIEWYNYKIMFYKNIKNLKNHFAEDKNIDYTFFRFIDNIKNKKVIVRNRKDGDRILIKNLGHKKIKKILIDEKIAKWERDFIPIIEAEIIENKYKDQSMKEKIILAVSDIKFSKFLEKINKNDIKTLESNSEILIIGRKNGR